MKNGEIAKVIGLDPASPLYSISDVESRLTNDSAKYVECIHTGFWLGTRDPICQVDFFVNGGMRQPECRTMFGLDDVTCSHYRAVEIYTKSIASPKSFKGTRCENIQRALTGMCRSEDSAFINDQKNPNKILNGIYFVTTV